MCLSILNAEFTSLFRLNNTNHCGSSIMLGLFVFVFVCCFFFFFFFFFLLIFILCVWWGVGVPFANDFFLVC